MAKHVKLFIPGPIEVSKDILEAMGTPMIGHRSKDFQNLYADVIPKLQKVLYTEGHVFIAPCSATGIMEGSVRNCVEKKALVAALGAFSDRWHDITLLNGKEADKLQVEWGKAITPEMVDKALSTGQYDAFCMVHNETSTGVMNPIYEIAEVMKKYPDVCWLVDSVSSQTGVKLEVDKLGVDVMLAGTQKAYALPPGVTVFTVSEKALEKSKKVKNPGYYFNFGEFEKYAKKNQTPTTPGISHFYALNVMAQKMLDEGLDNRFARHIAMAKRCRDWAKSNGFSLFPQEGYESITLTCISNDRKVDIDAMNKALKERGAVLSNGYGKLKGQTFRISHMGDCTMDELNELLGWIDEILPTLPVME